MSEGTVFEEGSLRFHFGSSWKVDKWDKSRFHVDGVGKLQGNAVCEKCRESLCQDCKQIAAWGTKAVDFVGKRGKELYLIEVKDFRGHEIENRKRLRQDLMLEVARKVRDTVAGLLGARYSQNESPKDRVNWEELTAPMLENPPRIVLWLEWDLPLHHHLPRYNEGRQRYAEPIDAAALGPLLKWLTRRIIVANSHHPQLTDLHVESLPRPT